MIRVAAVGDVHYDRNCRNRLRPFFHSLQGKADLLLISGDLTQSGAVEEAATLADDLEGCPVPVVAILGNHDYHANRQDDIHGLLRDAGVITLEGTSTVLDAGAWTVGVVGIKGFGGGFSSAFCPEFREPETKAFSRHAKAQAEILESELASLDTDFKFALLHYAPIEGTLLGEHRELYPFLGSYLLGRAIDASGASGVFHGHAHYGTERGATPDGIPVRNVAQTVIRHAYNIYLFDEPLPRRQGPDRGVIRSAHMPIS